MRKLTALLVSIVFFAGPLALSSTSSKVVVGAIANGNLLQGNIVESSSAFDIAISGNGFIPLQDVKGEVFYTRYGVLGMGKSGHLEHVPSGLKVVVPDEEGNLKPVHLESFAERPFFGQNHRKAKLTSMAFSDSGVLEGVFSDGQVVTLAKLQLAAFENQRNLRIVSGQKYLLRSTRAAGEVDYLPPGVHPAGKVFGHHLEAISMEAYKKALR